MPAKRDYTIQDATGATITKGDTVRVGFEGVVRSVTREGWLVLRMSDGTTAHYDPTYQRLVRLNK
jgi:hypothetical protein